MKRHLTRFGLSTALVVFLTPAASAQQVPDSLPNGVTAAMITEGAGTYGAQGLCFACHGPQGKGMTNLGADLTDDEWVHSDGSYEGILKSIETGVQASGGAVMPPNGGANLTDPQRKAVAAYVWSLSRKTEEL